MTANLTIPQVPSRLYSYDSSVSPSGSLENSPSASELSFGGSDTSHAARVPMIIKKPVLDRVDAFCSKLPSDKIKQVTLAKWHAFCHKVAKEENFSKKIEMIKEFGSYDHETDSFSVRVKMNGQLLDFVLFSDEYLSEAIAQVTFEGALTKGKAPNSYYYFKFYQNESPTDLILVTRSDKEGLYGEVNRIYKGSNITGNEVKTKVSLPLLEALDTETIFKHDASKKTVQCGDKKEELPLNMILPVVSRTGSDEEGATWYSKHDFSPVTCKDLRYYKSKDCHSQERLFYFAALEKVRTVTLAYLHDKVSAKSPTDQKLLKSLFERYLSGKEITFDKATLTDLGSAIFSQSAAKKGVDTTEASCDLVSFYKAFLDSRVLAKDSPKEAIIYNLAISTMEQHYFWARNFKDPSKNLQYRKYKTLAHKSFEQMIAKVQLGHKANWNTIVDTYFKNRVITQFRTNDKDVAVSHLTSKELMTAIDLMKVWTTTAHDRIHELCQISTRANFTDCKADSYWQLWIQIPQGKKKLYIDMQIVPYDGDLELTMSDYQTGKTLYKITLGDKVKPAEMAEIPQELKEVVSKVAELFQDKI